jgi:Fe2+ transport system protein FeoA
MQKTVKEPAHVDHIESLDKIKKGKKVIIHSLPEGITRIQLIRLGITIGSKVTCLERLPGGTIILQKNRQEIAIGYDLAKKIRIRILKENK